MEAAAHRTNLSWDLGPASAGAALGKLVEFARDLVRRAAMTPEERELAALVRQVAETTAGPLLAARSAADLRSQMDRVLSRPEPFALARRALRAATVADLTDDVTSARPEVIEVLGENPTARLLNGLRLGRIGAAEIVRLYANCPDEERATAEQTLEDPLAVIYEPRLPVSIREAMLDSLRSLPAMLAIGFAVGEHRRLEPWLALELASTFERGQRAFLRYVSWIDGSAVPESALPREERFDNLTLVAEQERAAQLTERWAAEAEASGEVVHDVVSEK